MKLISFDWFLENAHIARSIRCEIRQKLVYTHDSQYMGRAKVDPIDIKLKPGATAVTQGRREIPIQYGKPLEKKIAELLKYDLIEGQLRPNRAKG